MIVTTFTSGILQCHICSTQNKNICFVIILYLMYLTSRCVGVMPIWFLFWKSIRGQLKQQRNTHFHCEMHAEMADMQTLYPWTCQMLLHIYDSHVASQSFYMSQIGHYPFHRTFCFVHFELNCWSSSNNDQAMRVIINE